MNRRSFLKSCAVGIAAASVPLSLAGAAAKAKTVAVAGGIPYISLLQDLSPKVGYPGIAAGMLLNTRTGIAYNSIEFVPCSTKHVYVEWESRVPGNNLRYSGRFIGEHSYDSDIVRTARAESTQFPKCTTPGGNDLVETFYLYGLMVDGDKIVTRCVFAFSGMKIKKYRRFQLMVHRATTHVPLFAHKLRISAVHETCRAGNFYNYMIEPATGSWVWVNAGVKVADSLTPPDHPFIKAGSEFANQLRETANEQA